MTTPHPFAALLRKLDVETFPAAPEVAALVEAVSVYRDALEVGITESSFALHDVFAALDALAAKAKEAK